MKLVIKKQENKQIEIGDLIIPKNLANKTLTESGYRIVLSLSKGRFYNLIDLFGEVYTATNLEQINHEYSLVAKNHQLERHADNL